MRVLAVIPARGGSKGIRDKNIRLVHGKPLIAWTIECALGAAGLERIVVSSDDDRILDVARGYSRILARRRPDTLARDDTPIVPVVGHVLEVEEEADGGHFDAIMLLQPTSPLREPSHIEQSLAALADDCNAVISVCAMHDMHPARMYRRAADGLLSPMMPEFETARRQDIPPAYYRNGSIYLVRRSAFVEQGMVMAKPAVGYVMDSRYLLNLDEPRDMILAEALIPAWREGSL